MPSDKTLALPDAEVGARGADGRVNKSMARVGGAMTLHGQNLSREQVELIKRTVCKAATDDELALFITVANRTGLDPFSKQIHAVKRWDSKERREVMAIQTGIDGYRLVAQRSGQYGGSDDITYGPDADGHPTSAKATVYKIVSGLRCPVTRTVRWEEFVQTYKDRESGGQMLTPLWKRMPYLMLGKCAEAQALRAAFPQELSGIYTPEEMGGGSEVSVVEATVEPVAPAEPERDAGADEASSAPTWDRKAAVRAVLSMAKEPEVQKAAVAAGLKGKPVNEWPDDEIRAVCSSVGGPLAEFGNNPF